jgi:hypothetical protein
VYPNLDSAGVNINSNEHPLANFDVIGTFRASDLGIFDNGLVVSSNLDIGGALTVGESIFVNGSFLSNNPPFTPADILPITLSNSSVGIGLNPGELPVATLQVLGTVDIDSNTRIRGTLTVDSNVYSNGTLLQSFTPADLLPISLSNNLVGIGLQSGISPAALLDVAGAIVCRSNVSVGSNLDVSGSIFAESNATVTGTLSTLNGSVNIGGPALNFSGTSNPVFNYGCQLVANTTGQELSVAGWTATPGGVRKMTLYDYVYVSQTLNVEGAALVQNNPVAVFTGTQCNLTVPGNLNVIGQVLQNGAVFNPPSYMPTLSFNTDGSSFTIGPNTTNVFMSAPGNASQIAGIPSSCYTFPYINNSWLTGNDASSTPVTYKYMRVIMQAFTISGGSPTSKNFTFVEICYTTVGNGILHFTTDTGDSSVAWEVIDGGSDYGYQMQISPWYVAPIGYDYGALAISNKSFTSTIKIGSVTLQFR